MAAQKSDNFLAAILPSRLDFGGLFSNDVQPITLEVVSGLHSGARLELGDGVDTIGSAAESQIILRDEGVAPVHLRIVARGRQAELEAIGGEVELSRGETIPVGFGRRATLPVEFSIGSARVRLTGSPPESRRATLMSTAPVLAGAFALTVILALVANNFSQAETGGTAVDEMFVSSPQTAAVAPVPQTLAELAEALEIKLAQSGLTDLNVATEGGRLIVRGTVSKAQSVEWADIQFSFDQTNGSRIPLVSEVQIGGVPATPRLAMQAIWYGERPYVIAADGARYHEGAFIDGGWAISKIGETALTLTKDGATIALKYQ